MDSSRWRQTKTGAMTASPTLCRPRPDGKDCMGCTGIEERKTPAE